MSPEEIAKLSDLQIIALSKAAIKEDIQHFNPLSHEVDAIYLASKLDMTISFGDKVVLVSEPASSMSRTVAYGYSGRVGAMRRAVTLLAADCSQFI